MADPYRCVECAGEVARCVSCRARRAAAVQATRANKRANGICLQCARRAVAGYSRCKIHMQQNNALSGAAHRAARKEQAS